MSLLRINRKLYFVSLIGIFFTFVSMLYLLVRGNFGVTFSPVQPDSAYYLCRGLEFGRLDFTEKFKFLNFINEKFRPQSDVITDCGGVPIHYQARILLPALIAAVSQFKVPVLVLAPTLAFAFGSILVWWCLTRRYVELASPFVLLLALAPWLSPHFGGHVYLVLTEGPLLFTLVLILLVSGIGLRKDFVVITLILLLVLGISNRQSWPILAIFVGYSISMIFQVSKFHRLIALYFSTLILSAIVNLIMPPSPSAFISPRKFPEAFQGVIKGLMGDVLHLIKFLDLPGLIVLSAITITLCKGFSLQSRMPTLLLLMISLYSIGGVYLFDGSYSQNWRYFLPNGFLAIFILLKEPVNFKPVMNWLDRSRL